jgi:hypothetical protein
MKRILLLCSIVLQLVACGGGGGGGGAGNPGTAYMPQAPVTPNPPYTRPEVPFSTPVKQGTVDPLINIPSANNGHAWAVADTFTADLTGTGKEDVLIAGRMTQPTTVGEWGNFRLSMFGWDNDRLVDKTAQWFPNDTNIILGTEPSVKFDDFFKTGRNDLFIAPGTDMQHYGPTYFFRNTGNQFERQILTTVPIWSHDSAVGDLNGDGYKDILIADYGTNTTIALNNRVSSFSVHTQSQSNVNLRGASAVAIGDFLGNGQGQIIATDQWTNGSAATKLYSWSLTGTNEAVFTELNTLPTPRFELPKWSSHNFGGSHNVRAVSYDFNDDSKLDVLIFSRPNFGQTKLSEIQFLKNNGAGNFSDVTDTTLVGYNHNTYSTYNPKFLDLNGDGRTDILVSGADFSGNNTSHQFLLKSNDGKYVAAHQNLLSDFVKQAASIQGGDDKGNTVNVVRGPNNKLFLITTISFHNGSDRQLALYMSELGTQSVTTAQSAVNLILQKWPYMTVPQANEVLARTAATYFNGVAVINEEDIFKPVGQLSLATVGGIKPISGYLAGVDLGDGSVVVLDQLGRGYNSNISAMNVNRINAFGYNTGHTDQYELTSHAEYLVNGAVTTVNGMRVGVDYAGRDNTGQGQNKPTQYSVGVPNVYNKGKFTYGVQYTNLNQNPWIAFGGSWGSVNSSGILDNVVTFRHQGFSAQASLMHVSTNINSGLITRVNNMTGAWAETGYRFGDARREGHLGVYAGVKPVVLSGSVEARLPTSIDNQGNIQYTNKKLMIQNQLTPYVRALYTNMINKRTQYRFSAMTTANSGVNQYRVMHELRYWFD